MEHVDVHQVLEVRAQFAPVASVPFVGEADGLVLPVGPVHPVIVQGEAERMRQVLLYQSLQAKRMEIILNGTQRIFFLILEDINLFVGPLVLLFWMSGDVCPEFQSQGGFLWLPALLPACNGFLS